MRSHFHGGHDVAGSAARALPFDRLAVGVIAATVSPEKAAEQRAVAGDSHRPKGRRNLTLTQSATCVTSSGGENPAPNPNSPAVPCVPANLPEAAQPQAPRPAASGISFPVMSAEMAHAEAVKCGRHARICMDAGAYEEARHQLEEAKRYALLAVELGASA